MNAHVSAHIACSLQLVDDLRRFTAPLICGTQANGSGTGCRFYLCTSATLHETINSQDQHRRYATSLWTTIGWRERQVVKKGINTNESETVSARRHLPRSSDQWGEWVHRKGRRRAGETMFGRSWNGMKNEELSRDRPRHGLWQAKWSQMTLRGMKNRKYENRGYKKR